MSGTLAAAGTAVLAAALLGASSVAQRRGMLVASGSGAPLSHGLLSGLVSSRWWWAGTLASVAALVLQFLALTMGSLITVQTTMVSSIAAATLAEWLLLGRRPGSAGWAGMSLTVSGLVGVIWTLAPTGAGASTPSAGVMAVLGVVGLGAVGAAALRARAAAGGGLALAAATGLGYGVTAVALKSVGFELGAGWSTPFVLPALWVALLLGPASVLLSQYALQRAQRVAAAVSLIVVVDPLVGLFAGAAWFGERFTTTPGALMVAVVAAGAVVVGIAVGQSTPEPVVGQSLPRPVRAAVRPRRRALFRRLRALRTARVFGVGPARRQGGPDGTAVGVRPHRGAAREPGQPSPGARSPGRGTPHGPRSRRPRGVIPVR